MSKITLPPLPAHPEPRAFKWSRLEEDAIQAYAREAVLAERERCAQLLESFGNAPDIQCFAAAIRNQGEPTA